MRAWIASDVRDLKALTSGDFRMVFATRPCVMLDAPSWLKAAADAFSCNSYRFGDIYVRRCGPTVVFGTQLQVEASLRGEDLSGEFWLTSIWSKSRLRRRWRMQERIVSRVDGSEAAARAIASLQLWR